MSPSLRTRGVLLVASAGVLWSTLGLGVRLMEGATAWQIICYRGLFQAAAIMGWLLLRHRAQTGQAFRRIGWPGLAGALGLGIAYNGMVVALTLTSVATVVFIFSISPLVTGVLAWLLLRERVSPITFVAMAGALLGILVMTLGEPNAVNGLGALAAGVAVLGAAVFTVALRKKRDVDMLPAVALAGVAAALMSSVGIESFAMARIDLALSAYLGLALAIGLALFTVGSRTLSSAELPLVAMTESVLAPVWVWIFLGEVVSTTTLIGGAIVLGAVLLQSAFAGASPPQSEHA